MLATVRRSNCTCGFPACSFHEGSPFRDAIKVLTVLVNEWTFFASVGSIQSDSILGRKCTGISRKRLTNTPVRGGVCVEVSDDHKKKLSAPKRRTRAEVQQLVTKFVSSGMRRSEFCRSRRLSLSTLGRHLKKLRWKRRRRAAISSVGRLVPVELAARKSPKQHEPSCGLAVVLSGGRRIEVYPDFDTSTFERLVGILERA